MNSSTIFNELCSIDNLQVIDSFPERQRLSRDFFHYSPVLTQELNGCCADFVVCPNSLDQVIAVAGLCQKFEIPLTMRGSGTGNYGQCVPIKGGVVMLMNSLSEIRHFDSKTGQVIVEPGCLLKDLNKYLLSVGRQLRLSPSTWRSASVGGFVSGGSGGIGSVRWGFLRDPGNLLGLEVVTVESPPRKLQLDAHKAEALNHAYGTNGIITALTIATTAAVVWHEVTIDCASWKDAVALLQKCVRCSVDLYLCTLIEDKIVENLPNYCGESVGKHRLFILVSPDGISTLKRISEEFEVAFNYLGPENERSGAGLRELTWNHTTLHMRKKDSSWTYLQMLLPESELQAMNLLKSQWGDDILWHLECVKQQGNQRIAALPIIKWRGRESLSNLMDQCKEIGAILFNPHVITVEDGGLGVIDVDQVKAKRNYDPKGILNPGKLKGWT